MPDLFAEISRRVAVQGMPDQQRRTLAAEVAAPLRFADVLARLRGLPPSHERNQVVGDVLAVPAPLVAGAGYDLPLPAAQRVAALPDGELKHALATALNAPISVVDICCRIEQTMTAGPQRRHTLALVKDVQSGKQTIGRDLLALIEGNRSSAQVPNQVAAIRTLVTHLPRSQATK